jgi:hypothetical protein
MLSGIGVLVLALVASQPRSRELTCVDSCGGGPSGPRAPHVAGLKPRLHMSGSAQAAPPSPAPTGGPSRPFRLVGLVEVPALLGVLEPAAPKAVSLRAEPSSTAVVICTARGAADLETREHGYEELSAVVYEVRDRWYGIRCPSSPSQQLVWLSPADAGTFRPLEELVQHGLAYLTADWDRRLYQKPGATSHVVRLDAQQPDVTVADSTVVNGKLWFLVVVFGKGRCTIDEPAAVLDAGWIPAHAASGNVAAWFYSRGC